MSLIVKALVGTGELPPRHQPRTNNKFTGYSPEKQKELEAVYREAFNNHVTKRALANEAIRDLRAAERRLSAAAQSFIDYTQLKLALLPEAGNGSPTAATATPAPPAGPEETPGHLQP